MKKFIPMLFGAALGLLALGASQAGEVNGLIAFSAGTPARAAEVNGNFTAVKTAVDDNDARITTLKAAVDTLGVSVNCPAVSMVPVGPVCVDKYEASVWEVPATNTTLIAKIKAGIVTLAELQAAGAIQRGVSADDYDPGCPDTGNGCVNLYAVSMPNVLPSRFITWFQAAAASRNAGKRLPTNQEWQVAALGTPDPGMDNGTTDCNVVTSTLGLPEDPVNTGSRTNCVSDAGAFDMVGNLEEWVADWIQGSNGGGINEAWDPGAISSADAAFGSDRISGINEALINVTITGGFPAALRRGGGFNNPITIPSGPGVFALTALAEPTRPDRHIGFRAAR